MTSSTFRSRSYKIKEPSAVENTLEKDESTVGSNESPCHSPSTTRVSWKTLKIFSRTLSSIEKIRTTKNNNQSNNSNDPSPISPTRPAVIVTATGDSAISTLAPILKSSSRHLQHEVNSYIIKDESPSSSLGLETPSSVIRSRQGNSKAASEWKVLKNKLSSLRKRSSGSTSGSGVADESSNASVTPGPGDESESSGRRLSSNSRTGSARTSRSGSQDEGIVCKKEDLINLLTEATKVASVSPPIPLTAATSPTSATTSSPFASSPSTSSPTATIKTSIIKSDSSGCANVSPTPIGPRKVILKTSPTSSATIQLSDQQPIDSTRKLIKKSVLKKNLSADSNNSSNSNNNINNSRPCSAAESLTNESIGFVETRIVVPGKPSLKFDLSHDREPSKSRSPRAIQFKDNCDINNNNPRNSELNSSSQVSPSATHTITELDVNLDKNVPNESLDNQDDSESPSSSSAVAAVKWDESNVVDAMILGDAIQAFLKGMEASGQKPTEKRVLFKKQS